MQVNWITIIITAIASFGFVYALSSDLRSAVLAGVIAVVAGYKWIRVQKKKASDEIEYDERVNDNLRKFALESFAFSNLLLLIYLLVSQLLLNQHHIQVNVLIIYLSISFYISFFIGPSIVRKR